MRHSYQGSKGKDSLGDSLLDYECLMSLGGFKTTTDNFYFIFSILPEAFPVTSISLSL